LASRLWSKFFQETDSLIYLLDLPLVIWLLQLIPYLKIDKNVTWPCMPLLISTSSYIALATKFQWKYSKWTKVAVNQVHFYCFETQTFTQGKWTHKMMLYFTSISSVPAQVFLLHITFVPFFKYLTKIMKLE